MPNTNRSYYEGDGNFDQQRSGHATAYPHQQQDYTQQQQGNRQQQQGNAQQQQGPSQQQQQGNAQQQQGNAQQQQQGNAQQQQRRSQQQLDSPQQQSRYQPQMDSPQQQSRSQQQLDSPQQQQRRSQSQVDSSQQQSRYQPQLDSPQQQSRSQQQQSHSQQQQSRSQQQLDSPQQQSRSQQQQLDSPQQQSRSQQQQLDSPQQQSRSQQQQLDSPQQQQRRSQSQVDSPQQQQRRSQPQLDSPQQQQRRSQPQLDSPQQQSRSQLQLDSPQQQSRSQQQQLDSPQRQGCSQQYQGHLQQQLDALLQQQSHMQQLQGPVQQQLEPLQQQGRSQQHQGHLQQQLLDSLLQQQNHTQQQQGLPSQQQPDSPPRQQGNVQQQQQGNAQQQQQGNVQQQGALYEDAAPSPNRFEQQRTQYEQLPRKGAPTIRANPNFNAQGIAELLSNEINGVYCDIDREKVIQTLINCNNAQRQEVINMFYQMYGKGLIKELKDKLRSGFDNLIMALMELPVCYDATQLRHAMKGLRTKEVFIEIMTTRMNAHVHAIKMAYRRMFNSDLECDITRDTSGYFKRLLISLCSGEVQKLCHGGVSRLGADESAFNFILSAQNFCQLRLVCAFEYEVICGDICDLHLTLVKRIRNRAKYFAELIYNSLRGQSTRDTDLIRLIVTRSEIDLADIRRAYQEMYGKSLVDSIEDECSGDYKRGLVAIVKGNYQAATRFSTSRAPTRLYTVFEPGRDTAFVVEFYADWCGHCRAFAPFYRQFASGVKRWSEVVQVAAVNCADTFNGQICRSNSVAYFPMIKYFPRSANSFADGTLMESSHSGTNLRDQLATKILNEYSRFAYTDWPNLRHLEVNVNTRFEDLWQGTPPSANFLLIIFEQFDSVGVQSILDLWPNRQQIGVRRALSNSALIPMLGIKKFPYVAMFKRDDQQSIFMEQFQGPVTLDEAMQRVQPGNFISLDTEQQQSTQSSRPHVETIDCERFPDRTRSSSNTNSRRYSSAALAIPAAISVAGKRVISFFAITAPSAHTIGHIRRPKVEFE
uniref:Thioredoxin domain-containing protein n=1 Tax=Globodera pallida TaxID=36090 RepID=A0A183BQW8_GLOPA